MQKILLLYRSFFVALKFPTRQPGFRISWTTAAHPWSCLGFDAFTQGHVTGWGFKCSWGFVFNARHEFSVTLWPVCVISVPKCFSGSIHTVSFFFFFKAELLWCNVYNVMCIWHVCESGVTLTLTHWEKSKKQLTGVAPQFSTLVVVMVMWCICVCVSMWVCTWERVYLWNRAQRQVDINT